MNASPLAIATLLGALALTLVACSSDAPPTEDAACEPGRALECPCPGADDDGVQVCADDGSSWGACDCSGAIDDDDDDDVDVTDMDHDDDDDDDEEVDMGVGTDAGDASCSPPIVTDAEQAESAQLYTTYCASCHGADALGTALGPDLLEEAAEESTDELVEIILEGDDDMPPIAVSPEQATRIAWYLVREAEAAGLDLSERCED